jgi:prephenate dehydrogenase
MDLILISVPVNNIFGLIDKVLDVVGDNTLVFDVGSTKEPICNYLKNHEKRSNFLAAHPMAGTEFSGPKAAIKGLYVGKTNIICEFEKTDKKLGKLALEIFDALEMKTIYMDPKSHDVHVAYVSHLSHVSSFMLGKTVIEKEKNENNIFDLAGSGFESTVRLAKSSPNTWTPIFLQNKTNLAAAIDEYVTNLNLLKELIVEENDEELNKILNNTNRIKEILNKK